MSGKRKRKKSTNNENASLVMSVLKGIIIALIVTVAAVLALALVIKEKAVDDSAISAMNQIVKVISIFIAAVIASKDVRVKQLLAGAAAGFLYILFGYLIFSFIEGEWGDVMLLLTDSATGLIVGSLAGLIFGKLLKKDKRSGT